MDKILRATVMPQLSSPHQPANSIMYINSWHINDTGGYVRSLMPSFFLFSVNAAAC